VCGASGVGGDEASLFTEDIFGMYQKYAMLKSWKFEVLESSYQGRGGLKEATILVSGLERFPKLKYHLKPFTLPTSTYVLCR
jgi:peptide chain release factor 1